MVEAIDVVVVPGSVVDVVVVMVVVVIGVVATAVVVDGVARVVVGHTSEFPKSSRSTFCTSFPVNI